ncbi:hypothetical protein ACI3PL_30610, partial [Lacticaseibacillus paracasei]
MRAGGKVGRSFFFGSVVLLKGETAAIALKCVKGFLIWLGSHKVKFFILNFYRSSNSCRWEILTIN